MTVTVADTRGLEDLRSVIESYNLLAERLQESQSALQKEVALLRGELAEKNRQLARKNRLAVLGEMAAGVAHEIRNPLGGIELYAGLISREAASNPKVHAWSRRIQDATSDLSHIVGDILDFTRPVNPRLKPLLLSEVVPVSLDLASAALEAKGLSAKITIDSESPVLADFQLLQRAFLNVVLNAAEASPKGSTLTVTFSCAASGATRRQKISFADCGPGIDPSDVPMVFNPFFTRKDRGTGLGLAMVARIAAAHHASVSAANSRAGGAVFTFEFPVTTESPREDSHWQG